MFGLWLLKWTLMFFYWIKTAHFMSAINSLILNWLARKITMVFAAMPKRRIITGSLKIHQVSLRWCGGWFPFQNYGLVIFLTFTDRHFSMETTICAGRARFYFCYTFLANLITWTLHWLYGKFRVQIWSWANRLARFFVLKLGGSNCRCQAWSRVRWIWVDAIRKYRPQPVG